MFRLIEPSSGQNTKHSTDTFITVLSHSVSAHIMGSHTVYKYYWHIQ